MGSWDTDEKKQTHPRAAMIKFKSWLRKRSMKEKIGLGCGAALVVLLFLWFTVDNHDNLFVTAELVHFAGIGVLVYKLTTEKSCAGLSLKSQDLTAIFLAIRLYCSFVMEYDIHTILDLFTLVATLWVEYMMRGPLKSTYNDELDTIETWHVALPCAVLAFIAHPGTTHYFLNRILWAACVYTEAVSVFPQLRMMQKAQVVERFTAHYVFALGIARFLSCAHWVLQIMDGDSFLLTALGSGLWPVMVLLSEIVQTFILSDFCYYYVKSFVEGGNIVRLPAGVV
mmetsp:Transcript_22695/g.49707  ORF Transcript_22695/g.49707 Transcript_22695/m.49707 type:complete len:283 (-) Transcript_22695:918-1766(-)|eukprot:CAMPEP_0118924094 /NCGR_PEP_ID=MMETSP1169-20130426/2382_1 /TAXON_ID=36882 /ORGANISM="Pyramimonas obovata, Strain CCMP722" /LENGTH=282 /DNA_ID=CAMNT_0006865177 /DNA_START=179 /DNA_END=1027 /DNA_ORIENTATION=+